MNIFIETLGCPKNFNDSEIAAGILEENNFTITNNLDDAQVIMVNTCGFINDAKTESIEKIFDMAEFSDKLLIVSGCLSQRYSDELYDEMPEVDIFIGVNDYEKLPDIISNHQKGMRDKYVSEYEKDNETLTRKILDKSHTSTIKISEGCNNKCAYCVIPSIRGPYRSRKMENIINEAKVLASKGTKELILIAQDVTTYGIDLYDGYVLPELLRKLCMVDGIEWIRLMYCYEDRITDELIEVMASEDKICNYIDIPIQHASDNVLREMNRRSTRSSIDNTIARLRTAMPDIRIRTTLIVGFPGETEEDFDQLYDFVCDSKFDRLGVFAYSKEEGTEAGDREDQIDDDIKESRKDTIMRRQIDISLEGNKSLVGQVLDVIIDEIQEDGTCVGRTQYDAPEIDNSVIIKPIRENYIGDIIKVEIVDAFDYDLVGVEV
ncbi:MAG: 30S ribosomal protein S12 methylthiotransferase RimO [Anaerovoracaceae bacterium]